MKILIHFGKEFDFFQTKGRQDRRLVYDVNRNASVKDIIESLGVPHTEVGHLYFNYQVIDFSYIPFSPGRVDVKGIPSPFDVRSPSVLRPKPLDRFRFIADVNVIRLGRLLILLGFDVHYSSSCLDHEIADIAEAEHRIILTRDTDLLKRKKIDFARRIMADLPYEQLVETVCFFGLEPMIHFFSRCTACNVPLVTVAKSEVMPLLEPKTKLYFNTFFRCPQCKNVFWRGSHYDSIRKRMSSLGISIKS
ncbi:Mut7-C RNAse domain-containing protein [Desulfobacula sp.]|uniref:Mut7-C RNAse domain-containing protein n=1 Tax=Desulfobacula sp. TaxID=2593537 RepID=UPI002617A21F|nr:Mut7-C RNAse domain-containing protein [Desulfobacula sp.]